MGARSSITIKFNSKLGLSGAGVHFLPLDVHLLLFKLLLYLLQLPHVLFHLPPLVDNQSPRQVPFLLGDVPRGRDGLKLWSDLLLQVARVLLVADVDSLGVVLRGDVLVDRLLRLEEPRPSRVLALLLLL